MKTKLFAIISLLLLLCASSSAKTEIKRTGCAIEVAMKIAFYGDGADRAQIDNWLSFSQELWNGKWTQSRFGNCSCPVKFNFTYAIVGSKEDCPNGYHCIMVQKTRPGERSKSKVQNGAVAGAGYTTRPYEGDRTGSFDSQDKPEEIAHEIGHLLGLDDEYFGYKVDYTVDPNGDVLINKVTITYPRSMKGMYDDASIQDAIRERIKANDAGPENDPVIRHGGGDARMPYAPEDGIMSKLRGKNYKASPGNIDEICKKNTIDCPLTCCCGNGNVEASLGEECDKAASFIDCKKDPYERPVYCDDNCKCRVNESAAKKMPVATSTTTTTTTSTTTTTTSSTTTSSSTSTTTSTTTTRTTTTAKATTTTVSATTSTAPPKIVCQGSLHSDPDCGGTCRSPDTCTRYKDTECYQCACNLPDLYVSALAAHVSKSSSTKCTSGDYQTCTTSCKLAATASIKITNKGKTAAGPSAASVSIAPAVGLKTASIESLASGQTSETKELTYEQTGTVEGTQESCIGLAWWTTEYTATAYADMMNAIAECDETNNQKGAKTGG